MRTLLPPRIPRCLRHLLLVRRQHCLPHQLCRLPRLLCRQKAAERSKRRLIKAVPSAAVEARPRASFPTMLTSTRLMAPVGMSI